MRKLRESDPPAEVGVPDDDEVEGQEDQEAVEGEALEGFNGRQERLDQCGDGGELGHDVLPVLYAVEEGVEVTDGGD